MTLADLASHICLTVSQSETEDIAAAKLYLKRRFEMIWNDQLWKDSLFEYTQTLSSTGYLAASSTWLPTKNTLLLPTVFTHPVAVRTDTRRLDVESSELFYRQDFDAFASTGNARQYRLLSPCVWEFDTAQACFLTPENSADNAATVYLDILDDDGLTLTRLNQGLAPGGVDIGSILRLDAATKAATTGSVAFTISHPVTLTNNSGVTIYYLPDPLTSADGSDPQTRYLANGASVTLHALNALSASSTFQDYGPANSIGLDFAGTITLTGVDGNGYATYTTTAGSNVAFLTLAAADTAAAKRQRVQLIGTVPEGAVVRVLGKVKPPTFTADSDEPGLTGIENALIAFSMADMYRRERQLGKAQTTMQEGIALLEQLKKTQTAQQASHKRFIPEGGYGDDWGLLSGTVGPIF